MTTQKQKALELALEALDGLYMPNELERVNKAIIAINEALAQQSNEQVEPVAWCVINNGELIEATLYRDYAEEILAGQIEGCGSEIAPLYTHPPVPTAKPKGDGIDEAAMFAAQHKFLEWNRQQDERLVKVAYEYGVFQKAIELYNEAAHGIKE